MRPFFIVGGYAGFDKLAGGFKARQAVIKIELCFDDAVHAFRQRIFIRVAIFGHADGDAVIRQQANISSTAILGAPVGVMDQRRVGIAAVIKGHLQGIYTSLRQHIRAQAIAHDLTGVSIGDKAQVTPLITHPDVSNITHPQLLGACAGQFPHQVGILVHPVPGVGGNGFSFPLADQQLMTVQ